MGCCSSKQTGGANAFYGDGDIKDNSSEAQERQPTPKPTRAPSRAPSRANLFYNDGDEVETTSCFGSKSKSSKSSRGAKGKAKNRGTKDKDSPKSSRRKSGNAGSSATNQTRTAGGGRDGGSQQNPQSMSQIVPEASLFYRNQRVDSILDHNPRQRAMQDSYDDQEEKRRQQERAEEDKQAYLEKLKKDVKDKNSCFAGLCKPKRVGASNFHNQ